MSHWQNVPAWIWHPDDSVQPGPAVPMKHVYHYWGQFNAKHLEVETVRVHKHRFGDGFI